MILRDALVDNLELHESKSHKILSESVWRQLDEDTKNYVNRWEQELWPLLEEYEQLTEAEFTADQILGIFGQAEKFAVDSGKYQTKAGAAGEKAAQAGKAVAGGVKLASGVVSQINNKINELGKMIQDTTPVKNIDAIFDKAKKDLTVALGGKDSKIVASMEKLSELAKEHPGKAKFAVGVLTTAAAFAGGPAGGAAAGYVLRFANDLLAGEKLSTAVGKGAKTAAIGFLAGKAMDGLKDMFGGDVDAMAAAADDPEQLAKIGKELGAEPSDIAAQLRADSASVEELAAKMGLDGEKLNATMQNGVPVKINGIDVPQDLLSPDQLDNVQMARDMQRGMDASFARTADAAGGEVASAAGDATKKVTGDAAIDLMKDQAGSGFKGAFDASGLSPRDAMQAIQDGGGDGKFARAIRGFMDDGSLTPDQVTSVVNSGANFELDPANLAKMLKSGMDEMDIADIFDATGADGSDFDIAMSMARTAFADSVSYNNDHAIYETIYLKTLSGVALTEVEQQVVNEIGLADIKKFASNAAAKVGDAAKKAGGAIAGGAKAAAKEIGNQITVKKLTDLWNKSGKPTDAQSVSNVLAQAGMEPGDVTQVSTALPAPTAQQQAQGAQKDAGRPGIQQPQAGEQPAQQAPADPKADPNAGIVRGQGGRFTSGNQSGVQFAPKGTVDKQKQQQAQGSKQQPAQQQQTAQGGAQGTPAPKTGAQSTTSGAAPRNTGGEPADNAIDIPNNTKKKVNNIEFKWDQEQSEWLDPNGTPATGLMKQELMKQVNKDVTGQPPKPGMMQRAKDYISGKTPGLAQATRSDPKSSIARKAMGMAGAAIGGALAGGKPGQQQPEQPAQPGEQPAPQADAQPAQGAPKPVPGPTTAELKALQSKTLQGDLESAKALVTKLSDLKTKGYDADTFIQAAAPAMKRGGLAKSDPQAYAHFVKLARSMRAEAYQHMNAILEYAGLTWEDLGYEVLVSESVDSHVLLVPIEEIKIHEMKKLAGV